jgi:lysozyme
MINLINTATRILTQEEGYRKHPYLCSQGYATIGIGLKLSTERNPDVSKFCITMSKEVAIQDLKERVQDLIDRLDSTYSWFKDLDINRQAVLVSMSYQLGVYNLSKFKKMLRALNKKDYAEAYTQSLDSLWARQTPKRANRHANTLLTGEL